MFKIGLSIGALQARYGDKEALRIAKEIGADAVDFGLEDFNGRYDYRNKDSIYSAPEEKLCEYFSDLKKYADLLVRRGVSLKKGQCLTVFASVDQAPLVKEIVAAGIARVGVSMAGSLFIMIPPIIIFVVSQNSVIETMAHSGLKD